MELPNFRNTNLSDQFKEIGQDIKSNMPHIKIGNSKPLPQQKSEPIRPQNANSRYSEDKFSPNELIIWEKLQKWGLIAAIVLVLGYAGYRLLSSFF